MMSLWQIAQADHLDLELAGAGRIQHDVLDDQRLTERPTDGCAHVLVPLAPESVPRRPGRLVVWDHDAGVAWRRRKAPQHYELVTVGEGGR